MRSKRGFGGSGGRGEMCGGDCQMPWRMIGRVEERRRSTEAEGQRKGER